MATLRVFVPHYLENLSVKDVQLQQQRCQRYADCYKRGLDGYEAATEVEKAKRGRARRVSSAPRRSHRTPRTPRDILLGTASARADGDSDVEMRI